MWFEWLMVGVGLLLTVGTGLFVASEFALVNLDRHELENRRADGERRLDTTIAALKITSTHLSGAQLGITLTTLLTGFTFEPAVSALLAGPLEATGLPAGLVPVVGTVAGVALATLFSMVVGELVPKNFALALPVATAKLVLPFQAVFTMLFRPLIALFNNTANAIVRSFGIEPKEELSGARSAEELSSLVRRSALEGSLDADHATLISRTLRFGDRTAGDVMTPRVRMDKLRLDDTADDVLDLSRRTGRSRFPVIGEDADDIRGVVHIKQAFALAQEERHRVPAASLAVEPPRVPGVDDHRDAARPAPPPELPAGRRGRRVRRHRGAGHARGPRRGAGRRADRRARPRPGRPRAPGRLLHLRRRPATRRAARPDRRPGARGRGVRDRRRLRHRPAGPAPRGGRRGGRRRRDAAGRTARRQPGRPGPVHPGGARPRGARGGGRRDRTAPDAAGTPPGREQRRRPQQRRGGAER